MRGHNWDRGYDKSTSKEEIHTPLTNFVPTLVTNPLTLSDLCDESTSVEPGSRGASRATHSSNPSFRAASESCKDSSSHSSSLAWTVSDSVGDT